MIKERVFIGFLILTILVSGIIYVQFEDVKIRVDNDKTTFYVLNENSRWQKAGVEYNSLFDGTSKMNRRSSEITVTQEVIDNQIKIVRITPYIRGPTIIDTYLFDGQIDDVELFPISHQIEVINGSGYFYRYDVKDLSYDGESFKLDGKQTSQSFGLNMKVDWWEDYRLGWIYKNGNMYVKSEKIDSDYQVFNVRLFDPPTAGLAATEFSGVSGATFTSSIQGTDSTDFMYSGWLWVEDDGTDRHFWWGSNSRFRMRIASNDKLSIQITNTGGATIVDMVTTNDVPLERWFHLLIDIDTTSGTGHHNIYIDDSVVALSTDSVSTSGALMDFTRADNNIGSLFATLQFWDGCMSESYYVMGGQTSLDFSNVTNRRKFISEAGGAVDLGINGSTPTGTAPELYAPAGNMSANFGTAGNWTQGSGISVCPTVPEDINHKPTQDNPLLLATDDPQNTTNANLTAFNQSTNDLDGDPVVNIYNWYKDDQTIINHYLPIINSSTDFLKDYSGNNIDGTNVDMTLLPTGGIYGNGAYQSTANSQRISIGANRFESNNEGVIEAWIFVTSLSSTNVIFGHGRAFQDNDQLHLYVETDGSLRFQHSTTSPSALNTVMFSAGSLILINTWYHVAFVSNGTFWTGYIDGEQVGMTPFLGPNDGRWFDDFVTADHGSWWGILDSGSTEKNSRMIIDSPKVWSVPLSDEQVRFIYENKTDEIAFSMTDVGESWIVEITPNDGFVDGITKNSSALTIEETIISPATFNITADDDDGWQLINTFTDDDSSHLIGNDGIFVTQGGFRFQNVIIPQDSVITSAFLKIKTGTLTGDPTLDVHGNNADNAANWSSEFPSVSAKTLAITEWTPIGNTDKESIDITAQVQEIVARGGWSIGNAMKFWTGTTAGGISDHVVVFFRDSSQAEAAELVVEFIAPGEFTKVSYTIADGDGTNSDDGSDRDGGNWIPSNPTAFHGDFISLTNNVGFRWTNIIVPQGATIERATLQFKTTSGQTPVMRIYGNDIDDAPAFSGTDLNDFTKTTEFLEYDLSTNQDKLNIEIKDIVQEIIDRGSWESNNSIRVGSFYQSGGQTSVVFIEESGGAADAAILTIYYTEAPDPCAIPALGVDWIIDGIECFFSNLNINKATDLLTIINQGNVSLESNVNFTISHIDLINGRFIRFNNTRVINTFE